MSTFYELVRALARYGKRAVAYAWSHESAILRLIAQHATVSSLVVYVLSRY